MAAAELAVVTPTRIAVGPSDVDVRSALTLEMDFTLDRPVPAGEWVVSYMVDSVRKRHVIQLGSTEARDLAAGANSMRFEVSAVDVSSVRPSRLANVGLLVATLRSGATDIADINMVVQVSKEGGDTVSDDDGASARFLRRIFNPLD